MSLFSYSQRFYQQDVFVSSELSIGYTFGGKVNLGIGFSAGYVDDKNLNISYGLHYGFHLIWVKDRFHRHTVLQLEWQNQYTNAKFGFGRMRNGWGYQNRNRCISYGYAGDISVQYKALVTPKLGYRFFLYDKRGWAWCKTYYPTLYFGGNFNYKL